MHLNLYQGSRPSLADYAPLGLDTFEPAGCDRIDPTVKTDADPIPAAPTGRNLIAKGVSPGTTEQPFFGPEGDESTAGVERIDVDGINPTFNCYSTTIHVREGVHRKRNLLMSAFLVRYVGPNSRRCVPFRAEISLVPLYQGSRPSLADYAPLGLDGSLSLNILAGRSRPFGAGYI